MSDEATSKGVGGGWKCMGGRSGNISSHDGEKRNIALPPRSSFSHVVRVYVCVQTCAEKRDCFANHQPGVAGCGWLQLGRNFLST